MIRVIVAGGCRLSPFCLDIMPSDRNTNDRSNVLQTSGLWSESSTKVDEEGYMVERADATTTRGMTIVGVFESREDAEEAVQDLHRAGFTGSDIGYVGHGTEAPQGVQDASDDAEDAGSGAAAGVVGGGVLGGVLGAVAAGLIPGVGPIIGAGILAATL